MKTPYLHCGTNKTGSTFLQSLFTQNRELLKNRKIYYLLSHAEYTMLAGNRLKLSKSLTESEKFSIRDYLPYSSLSPNSTFELEPYQIELVIRAAQETEHAKALGSRLAQLWNKGVVKVKRHIKAKGL